MRLSYSTYFVSTERDRALPLHLTGIGLVERQNAIAREQGFHSFHWLHTVEGCGAFTADGRTTRLYPNQGILLKPGAPHSYVPETEVWATWYLTFDGALANAIAASLDIPQAVPLSWDEASPLANVHVHYEEKCRYSFDFAGIPGSLEVYAFLALVKQYGHTSGQPSLAMGHERLTPVYRLLEAEYGNPDLGLGRMAEELRVSPQYLNALFRKSWGISPYHYLLQFRIQKSKEWLLADRKRTVRAISAAVGFHDDSHFVQTFRRLTGMTPAQFRMQHGT